MPAASSLDWLNTDFALFGIPVICALVLIHVLSNVFGLDVFEAGVLVGAASGGLAFLYVAGRLGGEWLVCGAATLVGALLGACGAGYLDK